MRILIVKMSSLGDIIHVFPVLQYFKQCKPQCQIDWVVEEPFIELVRAHPLVNQVIPIQTKRWRSQFLKKETWREIIQFGKKLRQIKYDLIIDLQGNTKSGIVTGLAKGLSKVGFAYASVPEWPNLLTTNKKFHPPAGQNIREDYLFLAKSALEDSSQSVVSGGVKLKLSMEEEIQLASILDQLKQCRGLKILVCPGSNWTNKQLSKETLQSFLESLAKHFDSYFLFIWGNAAEKHLIEELHLVLPHSCVMNHLSLPTLQNLMTHVDLVLAMDSLPLHLAGTTSTSTYSVFGASSAQKYKPLGASHQAFQGNCPYGKTFEKRCPILRTCRTGECIKQLKGEQLFEHFHSWWSSLK